MKRTKLLKRRKRTKLLLIKFFITFLKEGREGRSLVVCHDELKKLVINSLMTFSKEVEVLWSPVLRGDLVHNTT